MDEEKKYVISESMIEYTIMAAIGEGIMVLFNESNRANDGQISYENLKENAKKKAKRLTEILKKSSVEIKND